MVRLIKLSLIAVLAISTALNAGSQDTLTHYRALNIPARKFGISIGNSYEFSGIRLNYADKNVRIVNGLNLTLWHKNYPNKYPEVNGISIGVWHTGTRMQLLNLGILGIIGTERVNGLTVGGLGSAAAISNGILAGGLITGGGKINGISLSGILTVQEKPENTINGLVLSGLFIYSMGSIRGISISGAGISTGNSSGLTIAPAIIFCRENFNGIGMSAGYMRIRNCNGITVSSISSTNRMNGVSIAIINITKELHGIQLGAINYAGNNKRGLKILPVANMHLFE